MPGPTIATETAALVLVDRCLDLVTPLSHADHLLDQIYGTLPRRSTSGHGSLRCLTLLSLPNSTEAEQGIDMCGACPIRKC